MGYLQWGTALMVLVFSVCYVGMFRERTGVRLGRRESYLVPFCAFLFVLFFAQLIAAGKTPGHVQDTSLFRAWAAFGEEHALWEYYTADVYVDYPPVYLYVLYGIGKLAGLFGVPSASPMFLVFVRSVPIFFDLLTSLCLFLLARQELGENKALFLAVLSALNPVTILNSTVWGQVDSVTAFFSALMLWSLYKKRYVATGALFALLFLTKPQTVIFAPLLGFVVLFDVWEVRGDGQALKQLIKQVLFTVLATGAVLLLVPLPITGGNYGLLIEQYRHALGLYPYATLNAANLYGLLGANWMPQGEKMFIFSYKTWGFIFIVAMSLCVGIGAFTAKDRRKVFYLGIFTVLSIYMLAHGMHERYLHPALLLMLVTYLLTKDRLMLWFYGAFSLTSFWGCGAVLMKNLENDFIYGDNLLFRLLSLLHLVLFVLWICKTLPFFGLQRKVKATKLQTDKEQNEEKPRQAASCRLCRADVWLMLGLTLFYALFGFYHLGSAAVPEQGWYAETAGESVVLDVGQVQTVRQLYLYTGWIDRRQSDQAVLRDITVAFSEDGETWQESDTPMALTSVFKWHVYRDFPEACRYIRLTVDDGRFYANEIALFGEGEADRIPIAVITSNNPTANCLTDEQEKVVYDFTWYENSYFDEIYHPRTAYEYITHRYPYENTHPPLGKVMIACGMLLFGVNPFGWRFFGTLCGVLMVPLVYVMGKKMLGKTRYAFMTAFVFAFDFMHLSQTRLATIDSYTAFFVMGMYLFMFLYIKGNFFADGVKKSLPALFASGVCFGLGAATKWQGIYAGFGLALLFFYNLYRQWVLYQQAKSLKKPMEATAKLIEDFPKRARFTILAGFGFFVLVPLIIYFLSYIPAMNSDTTGLSFFFTNQSSMYNYHANLEAPHNYGSPWWQWPFDFKPLYAYAPNRDFVPEGTSMGITSFGNPAVWWLTVPLVLWGCVQIGKGKHETDPGLLTCVVGFFSLYAPWMLVSRTTFIYHFFPCVVFVVLLLGFYCRSKAESLWWKRIEIIYMCLVFVLFVAYYPVLTGMAIPTAYAYALRWIPGWVLG